MRLNSSKCEFYKDEVNHLGHQLNVDGVQPLLSNVEAIQKAHRKMYLNLSHFWV